MVQPREYKTRSDLYKPRKGSRDALYTHLVPFSRLTTHHAAALKHDPTSVRLPATHMAATYDPSLLEMMAPVIGVPVSAATETTRKRVLVR
mgnify:CR=1 FL=1